MQKLVQQDCAKQARTPTHSQRHLLTQILYTQFTTLPEADYERGLMMEENSCVCIEKRIDLKLAPFCFKSLNGSVPTDLSDLLHLYTPSWQLRSSADTQVFRIPSFHTKSVLFLVPSCNNMEPTPRFCRSCILCQFLHLKTFLFSKTFSSVPLP